MSISEKLKAARPYLASDLEWVITSPFLLERTPVPDLSADPQTQTLIEKIRKNPSPLADYLTTIKRHTLGTYFEHLVFFWLENLDDVHIHASNLQVRDGKETIGELDLLFRYQGQDYHWELAVKFYALTGAFDAEENWVGPLKKDTLKRKLDRLYSHQLPLIDRATTRRSLDKLGVNDIQSHVFLKGMLFTPHASLHKEVQFPRRVSNACATNPWLELADLEDWPFEPNRHINIRPKARWFSTLQEEDWQEAACTKTLIEQVTKELLKHNIPQLLSIGAPENGNIIERSRLFVMPNGWAEAPGTSPEIRA
ncbi:MAG: DUF1853 family protein [Sneathiella sp.]